MDVRAPSAPPPPSDVSGAVGFVGLLGLGAWVLVCHFWPDIADALVLPGPREPLSGQYAALLGLVAAALPMVAWSLVVDKVHRRASTGIDWTRPRPLEATFDVTITKLAGLWATWGAIGFLYCAARWYWDGPYLTAMHVIGWAMVPLWVLSVPYVAWLDRVLVEPRDACWHFGALLIGREPYDGEQVKIHLRAWAVKGFFTAFMISIVPPGFAELVGRDWSAMAVTPVGLAGLLITTMFVIDEQIGTVGYILTMKPLDAQIRSANPLIAGWLAALACYPPFQLMQGGGPLFYQASTADWAFWLGGHTALLWAWGAALAVLTAIYAWATVAFGIRFSNLTYRGVLTNGPYRFTRHPAYLSKNALWWLATLPFLVTNGSLVDAIRNTFFLGCVSAIYFWRAKTEEKHLLAEDAKYRAYHAWMAEHGLVTAALTRIGRGAQRRRVELQPAE